MALGKLAASMPTKCIDQTPVASVSADPARSETAAETACAVEFGGKRKTDETALNGDCDGKRNEPRIMRN